MKCLTYTALFGVLFLSNFAWYLIAHVWISMFFMGVIAGLYIALLIEIFTD